MLAATWAELSKVWSRERFSDMRLSRKLATRESSRVMTMPSSRTLRTWL